MGHADGPEGPFTSSRWLPYALGGAGIVGGLWVLLFEPLPGALNVAVGWSVLAVAFGSVYYLVALGGGPGERGPDF